MDQATALLAALRATASLGDNRLEPARVEALAGTLGIEKDNLPALAARLQEAHQVEVLWGGVLKMLPEASSGASVVINNQGASFGPGATIAGHSATGGAIKITLEVSDVAVGTLAAVTVELQRLRPGLQGEAVEATDAATEVLRTPPTAGTPAEARRAWASDAGKWFSRLLAAAPQTKAAVELGEKALKGLGWG